MAEAEQSTMEYQRTLRRKALIEMVVREGLFDVSTDNNGQVIFYTNLAELKARRGEFVEFDEDHTDEYLILE